MSKLDVTQVSKTLSYWLRHRPDDAGLTLSPEGWAPADDVFAQLRDRFEISFDDLISVVELNDKQRFEFTPDLSAIRARQGHSVEVDLALEPAAPPEVLFHGTVERFLDAILVEGLKPMARHHVHLSSDMDTARKVATRRGKPVILRVDARGMAATGAVFFLTANGVWLTDAVAANWLTRETAGL
jgi:putative RNA 2'-phosphotransferase